MEFIKGGISGMEGHVSIISGNISVNAVQFKPLPVFTNVMSNDLPVNEAHV